MTRAHWPILLAAALALGSGTGCRGPGYYADKPPLEIAEMVDVHLADLGPGEAGYTAPTISARRSYRLAGRKDLDTGRVTHNLRLAETGGGEERYLDWARNSAEARVCTLKDARLMAGLEGSPAEETTFRLVDEQASCHPREECETYERSYKKKQKDEDGNKKTKIVKRVFRDCEEYWRCQSERLYEVAIDDRSLREASPLEGGMSVQLRWDCGRLGEYADALELPASYLQGYLLAVDGYPYTPLSGEPTP
jgi:hypothetical protein